ncbi:MAG: GtrA family protein [Nanoarchaeota archaeon]
MIRSFIKNHFWKFVMFCFVGLTATLIHIGVFNLFRFFLSFSFIIAVLSGVFVSIIYNFLMNRTFTFKAKDNAIKKQLPRFLIIYTVSITVNITTALLVNLILGAGVLKENIATISGIILSIPFSFFGSLLWAFKKD